MGTHEIRGVDVDFPYEPYDCQLVFMEKVIECLQTRGNALLESPTGTGKTLSLLCAILSWQRCYVARQQYDKASHSSDLVHKLEKAISSNPAAEDFTMKPPKVIYSSRTHSQLSQVVSQLKGTKYRPKLCLLGSRDQLCIHPEVSSIESSVAKQHSCITKVRTKRCEYFKGVEPLLKSTSPMETEIEDIEDLHRLAISQRFCPFFFSRGMQSKADIIFLPYNYLIDPVLRKSQDIDLKNSIIVFDEAHNLEGSCCEATSFSLTNLQISTCIEEANKVVGALVQAESSEKKFSEDEVFLLKDVLIKLFEGLNKMEIPPEGQTHPGTFLHNFLEASNVTFKTAATLIRLVENAVNLLSQDGKKVRTQNSLQLSHLHGCLKVLFREEFTNQDLITKHYRVHISKEPLTQTIRKANPWKKGPEIADLKTINFWCFNPGETMKDLIKHGARNIILTSGTLSPLNSFALELQIPFQTTLENPHIIQPHQVWAGVIPKGPSGVSLNSSFKTRDELTYKLELGKTIVEICKSVPQGLLVFFPSYAVLESCLKTWRNPMESGNLWTKIEETKTPMVEPKKKGEFNKVISNFYERVNDSDKNGAVLFAVCRGKVSEGIDFADSRARGVVITGLPFPPLSDPKVVLKRRFLDEEFARRMEETKQSGEQRSDSVFPKFVGDDWYQQQATRTVNQAVGRVIRHRWDYGAVMLCDERFSHSSNISQLPLWLRPYVAIYDNTEKVSRSLKQFFFEANRDQKKQPQKVNLPTSDVKTLYESVCSELQSFHKTHHSEDTQDEIFVEEKEKQPLGEPSKIPSIWESLSSLAPQEATKASNFLGRLSQAREITKPLISLGVASNPVLIVESEEEEVEKGTSPNPTGPNLPTNIPKQPLTVDLTKGVPKTSTELKEKSAQFNLKMKEFLGADVATFRTILKDFKGKIISLETMFEKVRDVIVSHQAPTSLLDDLKDFIPAKQLEEYDTLISNWKKAQEMKSSTPFFGEKEKEGAPSQGNSTLKRPAPVVEMYEDIEIPPSIPTYSNVGGLRRWKSSFDIVSGKPSKKRRLHSDLTPKSLINSEKAREFTFPNTELIIVDPADRDLLLTVSPAKEGPKIIQETIQLDQEKIKTGPECAICKSEANQPFAARCGHICCFECWTTWLKQSLECPVCRQRTREKQLTKLFF